MDTDEDLMAQRLRLAEALRQTDRQLRALRPGGAPGPAHNPPAEGKQGFVFQIDGEDRLCGIVSRAILEAWREARERFGKGRRILLIDVVDDPPECAMCAEGSNHVN